MKICIKEKAEALFQTLLQIRRQLHQHPELGFQEIETAAYIEDYLEKLGLSVTTGLSQTGVVTYIRGAKPGPTVMLRADMDALKLQEIDRPYASQNHGIMHACGHDVHVTWLLGAASILSEIKEELCGSVKLVFQPAEEGLSGAKYMIDAGVLDDVDMVFGGHVWPGLDVGVIGTKPGPIMASSSKFHLTVTGQGSHAATPHAGVDPINIACQVYQGLQTIVSRQVDPTEAAVLSVTQIHGGTTHNIIPNQVTLSGTVRTLSPEMQRLVPEKMRAITGGITSAMGGDFHLDYETYYPVVVNDPIASQYVHQAGLEFGCQTVSFEKPFMTGEDFSFYLHRKPGAFFMIGTRNEEKGIVHPLHSPMFDIDEEILSLGAGFYAFLAYTYLNKDVS